MIRTFCTVAVTGLLLGTAVTSAQTPPNADGMRMRDMRSMLDNGPIGEAAATAYMQGAVDAAIMMEMNRRSGVLQPREFCGLVDQPTGNRVAHPAFKTRELVLAWEKTGRDMAAHATNFVFNYLSGSYGCR
jgi:hypothetical protein